MINNKTHILFSLQLSSSNKILHIIISSPSHLTINSIAYSTLCIFPRNRNHRRNVVTHVFLSAFHREAKSRVACNRINRGGDRFIALSHTRINNGTPRWNTYICLCVWKRVWCVAIVGAELPHITRSHCERSISVCYFFGVLSWSTWYYTSMTSWSTTWWRNHGFSLQLRAFARDGCLSCLEFCT